MDRAVHRMGSAVSFASGTENVPGSNAPLRVRMLGSEWFASRQGGLNRYFADLQAALVTLQEVEVSAAAFGDAPLDAESWGRVTSSLPARLLNVWRLEQAAPSVEVTDAHFALYSLPALRRRGGAHVMHFHGPWALESANGGAGHWVVRAKRLLERTVYKRADHLIVLSQPFMDIVVQDYGVRPSKVSVIPPGVDLERFSPPRSDQPLEGFRVVCVRRLEKRMGIANLLTAWQRLLAVVPEATLDVYGTGTYAPELLRLAAELKLSSSVTFHGRVEDSVIVGAYQSAHCSVVPSVTLEGFGLVALESLACGTPSIVTDCGGLPDAVRQLDASLVVRVDDADALFFRLHEAARGLLPPRTACRAYAEGFGWLQVASRHMCLYRNVLQLRGGSAT